MSNLIEFLALMVASTALIVVVGLELVDLIKDKVTERRRLEILREIEAIDEKIRANNERDRLDPHYGTLGFLNLETQCLQSTRSLLIIELEKL